MKLSLYKKRCPTTNQLTTFLEPEAKAEAQPVEEQHHLLVVEE
jgi:hypothetical protein